MKTVLLIFTTFLLQAFTMQTNFLTEQKRYKRVRKALEIKGDVLKNQLESHGLTTNNLHVLMVAYKEEQVLELYGKTKSASEYKLIKTYEVCRKSGELGPKRKQGDYQVPEGFYHIDRFNPASNFYLSLGLNYPNKADKINGTAKDLGGDIFIHGACVTVGCLPMTDDKMMEIYLYAAYAKNNGQSKIPVYSFPFKMSETNFEYYTKHYKDNKELVRFWNNLKLGYECFTQDRRSFPIKVDVKGNYLF